MLVTERVRVIYAEGLLELNVCLALLATGDVRVVTVVEALFLEHFFDALDIFNDLEGHVDVLSYVFIKWNKFHACN